MLDEHVTITVDGQEMHVAPGTLLWEACKDHGIDIPIFCYHTKLGPVGACRTCLVEVEGMTKGPITACSTPVTDGMKVRTRSPIVEKAQRGIFEFLLANHPLDCPICDRAGECPLQDQTFTYGPGTSRYIEPKRHHVKPIPIGPTIALDRERCVLCWRCVRFCSEIAEDKSIVLLERGDHSMVGTFHGEPYVSNFSGNVIELCPVGALTSRKQRFNFRPWELRNRPSVCPHCAVGCNIDISVRKNDEVIRFLSRDNPHVDDSWLCDRGRFNFEFINSPERLTSPLVRRENGFEAVSWHEALTFVANRLRTVLEESGPESVAGIASAGLTNEDLWVFKRFIVDSVGSANVDHYPRPDTALTSAQVSSLRALRERTMAIEELETARTIVLLGADPSLRAPVLELRIRKAVNKRGARLVVVSDTEMPLSSKASATAAYATGEFADFVRRLSDAPTAVDGTAGISQYLSDGPIAILYDDSFPGVEDKGDALQVVAEFVSRLSANVEVGVLPMLDLSNSMGARDLEVVPSQDGGWGVPLARRLLDGSGRFRAAIVVGSDLCKGAAPDDVARLSGLDLLVVQDMFLTETAKFADVVLPSASFAEMNGTFTNLERRVQAVHTAVPAPGVARSDWEILVDLSAYLDRPLDFGIQEDIWSDLRSRVPAYADISYGDLGARGVRAGVLIPVGGRA